MKLRVVLSKKSYLNRLKDYDIEGVIVGVKGFSDRFNACFELSELPTLAKEIKSLGFKLYVNLNVMIEEKQLDHLRLVLQELLKLDLDGIYFNDFAILSIADEWNFKHLLIYQSDTLMTNSLDALCLINFGIKSVVIAKELTLDEILVLSSHCQNIEMIIHGRINLSYSKRHFIDSYYSFLGVEHNLQDNFNLRIKETTRDGFMPILETQYGTSVFCDSSLCSLVEFKTLSTAVSVGIIDDIFMQENELFDSLDLYTRIDELDPTVALSELRNKYPLANYGPCFYYDKTAKKKEELCTQ